MRGLSTDDRATLALLAGAAAATLLAPGGALPGAVLLAVLALACLASAIAAGPARGGCAQHPAAVPLVWGALAGVPPVALAAGAVLACLPSAMARRVGARAAAATAGVLTLAALGAHAVVTAAGAGPVPGTPAGAVSLLGAALAFVAVHHLLRAALARHGAALASDVPRAPAVLALDVALALCGALLAVLWAAGPVLTALAAGPLFVVARALRVPALTRQAATDPKTGLFHVVHFDRELEAAIAAADRRDEPLAVIMVDLDHLRTINNRFGHYAGDRAIREVAARLRAAGGEHGVPARFGGEEFCLLLPGTDAEAAIRAAEALRADVEAAGWLEGGEAVALTVSVGAAVFPQHGTAGPDLMRAADAALYEAKLSGRNRVRAALAEQVQRSLAAELPVLPRLDAVPPAPVAAAPHAPAPEAEPPVAPVPAAPAPAASARLVPWYVGALLALAGLVAVLAGPAGLLERPVLVGCLVASVLVLDAVRIDLFERGTISPASVPTLALAAVAGPIGPIAAELAIALVRIVRRVPAVRWGFDLGAFSLVGAAAAGAYALLPQHGLGLLLVAGPVAGLVYYVLNVAMLAGVMGLAEGIAPRQAWRERLAWLWPHFVVYGVLGAAVLVLVERIGAVTAAVFAVPLAVLWLSQKQYVDRVRGSVGEARRRSDELARANRELQRLLDEKRALLGRMQRSYLSTITSLARTIEAKDPYTGGHTERVARVAVLLAGDLGLDAGQRRAVEVGAVIHDIGKVGVPDRVLLKPGRLDEDELALMRRHPEISTYIVGELELPPIVKQMVRSHHERFDGRGYPDGLAGEEIPLAARILAVADTFDAMTSDRPYRPALTQEAALAEIRSEAGRQFCPRVVAALLARLDAETPVAA